MKPSADVIVVGGGVIGCSCAYFLAKRGARVLLVERDRIAAHASGGAAGMLVPLAEAHLHDEFFRTCVESLRMFDTLAAELKTETGIDIELLRNGTVYPAANEIEVNKLQQWVGIGKATGLRVQWLSSEDLRKTEPSLSQSFVGGLFSEDEHQVRSLRLTQAFCRGAIRAGATVTEGATMTQIASAKPHCTVTSNMEALPCKSVVIAAGSWSQHISRDIPLNIRPVRGQLMTLAPQSSVIGHTIYVAGVGYLVPKADGTVIVGATQEEAGFECRPTAEAATTLLNAAHRLVPALTHADVVSAWAGLRPASPDGLPMIGSLPGYENVFVACGHFRNGILLSPITGKLICDAVLNGSDARIPEAFSVRRLSMRGSE